MSVWRIYQTDYVIYQPDFSLYHYHCYRVLDCQLYSEVKPKGGWLKDFS